MIEPVRLLAFAFAGADFLFEIDRQGNILFATGATSGFSSKPDLAGAPAVELFFPAERSRFSIIARGLTPGERVGPLPMTLANGDKATLSMCYLPQSDRISCTLVKPGKRVSQPSRGTDKETGLSDRNAFLASAAENAGGRGAVALVDVPELPDVCSKLSPQAAASLLTGIGANMKAMGATVAARLSKTGFGVVTDDPHAAKGLAQRIQSVVREQGIQALKVEEVLVSLKGQSLTPEQNVLALRHVIGRFSDGKLKAVPGADLSQVFDQIMKETVEKAQAFTATVADGAFELAFQPIVNIKTAITTHYEALTRFEPDQSPAEMIKFAEELGLADAFDLAVAVKLFHFLEQDPAITAAVALNVSGRSIATPSSFAMLAGLLARKRQLAKRVLIEITESAEITDLATADKAIQSLRQMGYRVGIDDFGAGAASLQYLQGFTVDFVKVDGAVIQRLGKSPREDALLRSVVRSCAELHIETIAEFIDSPERKKLCIEMGFGFGQGHLFGAAAKELPRPLGDSGNRARRKGVQETWG